MYMTDWLKCQNENTLNVYTCLTYKFSVLYKVFIEKLYSDWLSEWQTENTSKVNIFNKKIFLLHKINNLFFGWYKGKNK